MPNWCDNILEVKHKDPVMLQKVIDAWNSESFMQTLYPCPQDLRDVIAGSYGNDEKQKELEIKEKANIAKYGYPNWYDWCVANWGTKWDIDTNSCNPLESVDHFEVGFSSAWSPPVEFYMYLTSQGYDVKAYYYESGVGFCGKYTSEHGEDTYKIDVYSSKWVEENIPEDINKAMDISESMHCEEMQNEE